MKILYDDQIFTIQHFGGISRYFCELMAQFSRDPEIDFRIALRYSLNEHLIRTPRLNRYWTYRNDFFTDSRFLERLQKSVRFNILNHVFRNRDESIRQLKTRDFDVFHPTYFDPYFLPHLGTRACVTTIYDMTLEKFPEHFPDKDDVRAGKRRISARSDRIIAISESTKRDIVAILGIPEEKIRTVYLGGSLDPAACSGKAPEPSPAELPDRYLLFVGNRFSYKNFTFMVEALGPVFAENSGLHLICTGGGNFSGSERELFRKNGIVSRVRYFPADDATQIFLYRNAEAFVFPSLYEGFGLPVVDAFNCGCPAILADTSSLPEVGGDAALYFNPYEKASLSTVVQQVLSDEGLRKDRIVKGRERARIFSWEKTAAMTKEVYREALEGCRSPS